MLLWQRIEWHKRHSFLAKLFLVSTLGHGLLLFVLLFFYKGENFTHTVAINSHDMTVMFMPFQTTASLAQLTGSQKKGGSGLRVINIQKKGSKVTAKKKKATQKTALNDGDQKTKKENKKEAEKAKKEKELEQKKEAQEKLEEKKTEEKKTEEQEKLDNTPQDNSSVEVIDLADENVVYAGQQDFNAFELRRELLAEIEQAWTPPAGMTVSKCCKVRVLIGWGGMIEEITFEEPSQIVAFDASVRHALLTMKFPKSSHGKELILPFH